MAIKLAILGAFGVLGAVFVAVQGVLLAWRPDLFVQVYFWWSRDRFNTREGLSQRMSGMGGRISGGVLAAIALVILLGILKTITVGGR